MRIAQIWRPPPAWLSPWGGPQHRAVPGGNGRLVEEGEGFADDRSVRADVAGIRAYWLRVEADTAARRELVDFLVEQLSGRDDTMPQTQTTEPMRIRYAALSDQGTVRAENQDAAYAGPRLFAVADGFGARGEMASSTAIDMLRTIDAVEAGDLLNVLQDTVDRAHRAVGEIGEESGTTLTAMLWTGSELGLVHIGDSRAYLLRDGRFFQITHDHTLVQSMLDEGRITPQEAESHPQRTLLVQALAVSETSPEPELRVTDVQAGDRYLLCTDGISRSVAAGEIRDVLAGTEDPADAVRGLIELATSAGGADNAACVVASIE